jgi:putative transposase
MRAKTGISERRACRLVGLSRTVLHYEAQRPHLDSELRARLVDLAQERRRFGYRRLHILLARCHGSPQWSHSRIGVMEPLDDRRYGATA